MVLSAIWMRNNMLSSGDQQKETSATETEQKVQRSVQKSFMSAWYLNKRSTPPKVTNTSSVQHRPSPWKSFLARTSMTTSSAKLSDSFIVEKSKASNGKASKSTKIPAPRQLKSPETKVQGTPSKASSPKEKKMDTWIPIADLPKNVSRTFPKMSPSRRIQNINLVLPITPKIDVPKEQRKNFQGLAKDNAKTNAYVLRKQTMDVIKPDKDATKTVGIPRKASPPKSVAEISRNPIPTRNVGTPCRTTQTRSNGEFIRRLSSPKTTRTNVEVAPRRSLPIPTSTKRNIEITRKSTPMKYSEMSRTSSSIEDYVETPRRLFSTRTKYTEMPRTSTPIDQSVQVSRESTPKRNRREEIALPPMKTPETRSCFKVRATSTPKYSDNSMSELRKQLLQEYRPIKKVSPNILERSSIFERSSRCTDSDLSTEKSFDYSRRGRKLTQYQLDKTFVSDDSKQSSHEYDYVTYPGYVFEKNISSIESGVSEREEDSILSSSICSSVRDMVRKLEGCYKAPQKTSACNWRYQSQVSSRPRTCRSQINQSQSSIVVPKFSGLQAKGYFDLKTPSYFIREHKRCVGEQPSCTRFPQSSKRSTELENAVENRQIPREKGVVREIINTLSERASQSSLPRQSREERRNNHEFVKKVVHALENGNLYPKCRSYLNEEEEGRSSEYETKTYSSSISNKDTDITDSDIRTPNPETDEDDRFIYDDLVVLDDHRGGEEQVENDESIYWIPVPRSKLPRTSSLLSMMSRLSAKHSPCLSPIKYTDDSLKPQSEPLPQPGPRMEQLPKSESESQSESDSRSESESKSESESEPEAKAESQKVAVPEFRSQNRQYQHLKQQQRPQPWGVAIRRTMTKKVFKIDETVVIDSGYSDKSDRSASVASSGYSVEGTSDCFYSPI